MILRIGDEGKIIIDGTAKFRAIEEWIKKYESEGYDIEINFPYITAKKDGVKVRKYIDVRRYVKALSKQYRRAVEKRKFINLLWIPTWTRQGYMQILQQTRKVQEYAKILHHTEAELSPKLAQAEFLEKGYEAQKLTIEGFQREKSHKGN